jgi:hypothetical protein
MLEQPKKWNTTCNRFVAFMDIMGFKDMIFRNTHASVLKTMMSLLPTLDAIKLDAQKRMTDKGANQDSWMSYFGGSSVARPVLFSDSILLVSSDDSVNSARVLLFHVSWILSSALEIGIPIKGAIAYGKQTADFDKSLHFGRPLIDAYELQNELLLYGVALHHTAEQYLVGKKMMPSLENSQLLCKYQTPLRNGTVTHYVVGWLKGMLEDGSRGVLFSGLYAKVSGAPRCYVDNTADFAQWLSERVIKG